MVTWQGPCHVRKFFYANLAQFCFAHFAASKNLNVAGLEFRFLGRGAGSVAQAGSSAD